MFATLSDRLENAFSGLRSKGRLTEADIDATCREIRIALLEADVALPVVKSFVAAIKERARGSEVSRALNPAVRIDAVVATIWRLGSYRLGQNLLRGIRVRVSDTTGGTTS